MSVPAVELDGSFGRTGALAYVDDRWEQLPAGSGVVPYYRVGRTAISVGRPLVPAAEVPIAFVTFENYCRDRRWRPLVLDAPIPVPGLPSHVVAREAIVDVPGFTLAGSRMAALRHNLARARRVGLQVTTLRWAECDDKVRDEMRRVSSEWARGRWLLGLTYGRMHDIPDDALISLARAGEGKLEGFASCRVLTPLRGAVLDLLRRGKAASPGAMDCIVVALIEAARGLEFEWMSLGDITAPDSAPLWLCLLVKSVSVTGSPGLERWKSKCGPQWEDRYLALPAGPSSLPALVALGFAFVRGTSVNRGRRTRGGAPSHLADDR